MDEGGKALASASTALPISYPRPGWVEQDPRLWLDGLVTVVRRALDEAGVDPESVAALAVAAQVDCIVGLDDSGQPVGPAPVWMDRRATAEADSILERIDAAEARAITGLNVDASHGAPKIEWLRRHRGAKKFAPPAAFVVEWLTGECVMDRANASSLLLWDVRTSDWSRRLLEVTDLSENALPSVGSAHDIAGSLRRDVAELLGLSTACVVAVGTGDEHAAFVGAGALEPDIVAAVSGTAEPVGVSALAPISDANGLLETHEHAAAGRWLIENPGFVSGGSVRWLADVLMCNQQEVFELAAAAPAGAAGVLFLPALGGSVTPRWDAKARGAFAGLTVSHGRGDLARAVLEGCAFAVRDIVDRLHELGLGARVLRVVGGGARAHIWNEIKADVTGMPIDVARDVEATSLGAALLASVAAGWHPDVHAAARSMIAPPHSVIEPRSHVRELYEDAYRRYRQLFDVLEPTFTGADVRA